MKIGSLVKCVRDNCDPHQSIFFGVIIEVTPPVYQVGGECTWVQIHWADGHETWEEWEASIEDGCFEVVA